jgi:hypothetical protein
MNFWRNGMARGDLDSVTGITRQGKGLFVGIIFIAWGLIGSVWAYYNDADVPFLHALIWIPVGVGLIGWYTLGPDSLKRQKRVTSAQSEFLEAQAQAYPQTVADWARRVVATGYVDDGETLIKQLGGSVVYQDFGEIFTHEKITVRLPGEEHSFESKYDMVQWIVKDLVPKVLASSAKPSSK